MCLLISFSSVEYSNNLNAYIISRYLFKKFHILIVILMCFIDIFAQIYHVL